MKSVVLPETFLRCVKPEDREKLKLGLTAKEFMAKGAAANEKALQRQIVSLLRLKGIEPIVSAMHKRTSNNVGTPDILFCCVEKGFIDLCGNDSRSPRYHGCAWEIKMPGKQLEHHQLQMAIRMSSPPNGWRHRVIRSVDEAIAELKEMGIE